MRTLRHSLAFLFLFFVGVPLVAQCVPIVSVILSPFVAVGLVRLFARIFAAIACDLRTLFYWNADRLARRRENGATVLFLSAPCFQLRALLAWFFPRVELPRHGAAEWMHAHGGWKINAAEDEARGHFILPDGTRVRGKIQRLGSTFRTFFVGAAPFTNHCLHPVKGTSDWFIHPASEPPTSFEAAVRGVEGWVRIVWPGRRSFTA